ncbi:DUF4907 domain-containing protein [Ulvibacter litoralis]|uniref:DUF4907 domain-containing protein n=1 Tax=Ulvibacter litoralis TaxID=227084 RepID=A0A1G7CM25_9FLAO|nr:DUF4907 domain-containing protein [Ulvibacter litoralis]GHC46825.1 hypothetical protein GCM10008083_07390 [Ulvibacter litoralis]SDE40392.1 protein of unknown function [Ulvibacter litoralis]
MKLIKFCFHSFLLVATISLLFYFLIPSEVNVAVHPVGDGYGYSVSVKNKTVIKQDFIPAIQEQKAFCTFEDAQTIGTLIKRKIEKKENPSITLSELKENNISFLCN